MAKYKPWTEKEFLYEKYVVRKLSIEQIAQECTDNGYPVTFMTIYNWIKKFNLNPKARNLGKRSYGVKPSLKSGQTKKGRGFY